MRKIARFNLLLYFLSSSPPLPICLPLALLFLSHTSFLPPLGENYRRIYTPDSLLSCIIRLIPKFLRSFALAPLSIFFISFPLIFFPLSFPFVLLFSFLFRLFPLFLPFSFPFLSFPSFLDYRRIYTPGMLVIHIMRQNSDNCILSINDYVN